ncbi:MAG TPA: hypothetical protein VNZ03_16505 [Terriglobales bacterium]|nr:hypothetical protein [Terriglobales bacterium]
MTQVTSFRGVARARASNLSEASGYHTETTEQCIVINPVQTVNHAVVYSAE